MVINISPIIGATTERDGLMAMVTNMMMTMMIGVVVATVK